MKIVVLDGYTENPGDLSWAGFEALGSLTVYDRTPFVEGNAEILRRARGAEAVIVNKTPLSAETIGALLPELRYIGVLATGFNVVDIAAAKAAGIPVCNIPTYGTTAVAQFAMALLLELCHHVADHSRSVKAGDWSRCPDFCYWNTPLIELAGKTFGVIGYGRIGQATARAARRSRNAPRTTCRWPWPPQSRAQRQPRCRDARTGRGCHSPASCRWGR